MTVEEKLLIGPFADTFSITERIAEILSNAAVKVAG